MAIPMSRLIEVLREHELRFKESDSKVIFGLTTKTVTLKIIVNLLEDGEYLDIEAFRFGSCPKDHPRLDKVLEILAHANYRYRLVRFGWDPKDGEIDARTSLAIEDNPDLPKDQFGGLLFILGRIADEVYPKLQAELGAASSSPPQEKEKPTASPQTVHDLSRETPARSSNAVMWVFAIGVLLMGLAAIISAIAGLFR